MKADGNIVNWDSWNRSLKGFAANDTADESRAANDSASETDSRQANMATRSYCVSSGERRSQATSLVDRGANGMIAGTDVRLIARVDPRHTNDVTGLADHQITDLSIGSYGLFVKPIKVR